MPLGVSTAMGDRQLNIPYRLIYELGNASASHSIGFLLELVTQKCRRKCLRRKVAEILLLDVPREELYFPYLADLNPEVARRLAGLTLLRDSRDCG